MPILLMCKGGQFVLGPRQQLADFFICSLRDFLVPQSDVKWLRHEAADVSLFGGSALWNPSPTHNVVDETRAELVDNLTRYALTF